MNVFKVLLISMFSFIYAACPEGFFEDDCGNCWLPYCYNYVSHSATYDISEHDCVGGTLMWVVPGDPGDPYFNNYCDSCPFNYERDDCGNCWMSYCYTFFSPGLNGDPSHSVYYDLSEVECEEFGFGYYEPNNAADPYWNSTCTDCTGTVNGDSMVDDCGDCQQSYCYDYVIHTVNFDSDYACDGATEMSVAADSPSNPYWNSTCTDCVPGDADGDGQVVVLDVVILVDIILSSSDSYDDCSDINQDDEITILDIVAIVEVILGGNARSSDATSATMNITNDTVSISGNGFIGAIQMTLSHGAGFSISLTDDAMVADYRTNGDMTTLIVVAPNSDVIFTASGEFEVEEAIVAGGEGYVPLSMPNTFTLSAAYPNPFNPSTSLDMNIPAEGYVSVQAYNLAGQVVGTIAEGNMSAGTHSFAWDASDLSSGVYLIKAQYAGSVATQKVMLLK